ncbi:hypothetical protein HanRHA438_Chr16g0764661 [Helianthus annuus]|nr:hypothetical protein HanRHA438_Chr16g0764661 [Helianthus annuus]
MPSKRGSISIAPKTSSLFSHSCYKSDPTHPSSLPQYTHLPHPTRITPHTNPRSPSARSGLPPRTKH